MKRELNWDLLRIIACFAVVLLHVSFGYWSVVAINSRDFLIMTIYNSLTRFGVPVFFMLSGMFLCNPAKEMPFKKWVAKIRKLMVCFFLWSLFYAFQSVLYNGFLHGWNNIDQSMWSAAITRLVMGHSHMWFLLDLMGFYLLLPILRKVCEDIRITGYFLLLWVIVRYFVTTMLPRLGDSLILVTVTSMHLYILTGYIGYFMGGYYLRKADIPKWARYILYVLGAGAAAFTMLKTLTDCRTSQTYDDLWFSPSNINILLFSTAVFVFFKYWKIPAIPPRSNRISEMGKTTFFVYMAHPFFLEKLNLLGINVLKGGVVWSIPVMAVTIFSICMMAGYFVRKIPVIGNWITFQ